MTLSDANWRHCNCVCKKVMLIWRCGSPNAALWHRVLPHVTFKYEINNLFDDQPKFLAGNRLQYVNEIDDYGRAAFFHIVLN